jgi:phosphatidylglycerol:prolipoprotein diacylglycerol transferase
VVEFFPTARVIVTLGPVTVYWYGLLYVAAFGVVYFVLPRLQRYRGLSLTRTQLLELVTWGAVGVVAGGRLGYVLLYAPLYYIAHPGEIFLLSQGGMSSHGGFIGVALAIWLFVYVVFPSWSLPAELVGSRGALAITPLALFDIIVVPAGVGLALGRLGNVINQELYVTPLAQLVAVGAPILMAVICYWHLRRSSKPGTTTGLFLILYSVARFGEEFLREPEWPLIFEWVTYGQLYTAPLLLIGVWLLLLPGSFAVWSKDEARRPDNSRRQ